MARACNRLEVPNSWIGLESLTGPRESLFFDPFDSFEQLEQSFDGWKQIYAAHPDLARMQEEIDALLISERTIVAVRRDDLGYHADSIDLSETRFMRVAEVRLAPGRENEFVETFKILGEAFKSQRSDRVPLTASVVVRKHDNRTGRRLGGQARYRVGKSGGAAGQIFGHDWHRSQVETGAPDCCHDQAEPGPSPSEDEPHGCQQYEQIRRDQRRIREPGHELRSSPSANQRGTMSLACYDEPKPIIRMENRDGRFDPPASFGVRRRG